MALFPVLSHLNSLIWTLVMFNKVQSMFWRSRNDFQSPAIFGKSHNLRFLVLRCSSSRNKRGFFDPSHLSVGPEIQHKSHKAHYGLHFWTPDVASSQNTITGQNCGKWLIWNIFKVEPHRPGKDRIADDDVAVKDVAAYETNMRQMLK